MQCNTMMTARWTNINTNQMPHTLDDAHDFAKKLRCVDNKVNLSSFSPGNVILKNINNNRIKVIRYKNY